jgi:hypothetical protein
VMLRWISFRAARHRRRDLTEGRQRHCCRNGNASLSATRPFRPKAAVLVRSAPMVLNFLDAGWMVSGGLGSPVRRQIMERRGRCVSRLWYLLPVQRSRR